MPAEDRKHLYLTRKHEGNNWKKKQKTGNIFTLPLNTKETPAKDRKQLY